MVNVIQQRQRRPQQLFRQQVYNRLCLVRWVRVQCQLPQTPLVLVQCRKRRIQVEEEVGVVQHHHPVNNIYNSNNNSSSLVNQVGNVARTVDRLWPIQSLDKLYVPVNMIQLDWLCPPVIPEVFMVQHIHQMSRTHIPALEWIVQRFIRHW